MKNKYLINEIQKIKKEHATVLISVVGAGGKTTTVFQLANHLKKEGSVLVTTTTAMFHPHEKVDHLYYKTLPNITFEKNELTALFTDYKESKDKVSGIDKQMVNQYVKDATFDYIINEADGARRRPLKCYADHEPVIPEESHIVIVVLGADAIGKVLSEEVVHRLDDFTKVTDLKIGDIITSDSLINLLTHNDGYLKDLPEHASTYVLINKSLSYPVNFDKTVFTENIFKRTNKYNAILFTEMMNFEFESVFQYKIVTR